MKAVVLSAAALGLGLSISPSLVSARAAPPQAEMLAPGILSTAANEFGGSVTPDGGTIYYAMSVPYYYRETIVVAHRARDGHWGPPEVAPFAATGRAFDALLSPDGRHMVFSSDRPTRPGEAKHDFDLWLMDQGPDGRWGAPWNPGAPVNVGERNAHFGSLASDGTLYFSDDPRDGTPGMRIYRAARRADGGFETPEDLGPAINASGWTGEPVIAPDQSFILFSAIGRPDGKGYWDVYISRRKADGSWDEPENLGEAVNTPQRDYSPRLMPDGHTLIFTSERWWGADGRTLDWTAVVEGLSRPGNGLGDLYTVDLRALGLRSFPAT